MLHRGPRQGPHEVNLHKIIDSLSAGVERLSSLFRSGTTSGHHLEHLMGYARDSRDPRDSMDTKDPRYARDTRNSRDSGTLGNLGTLEKLGILGTLESLGTLGTVGTLVTLGTDRNLLGTHRDSRDKDSGSFNSSGTKMWVSPACWPDAVPPTSPDIRLETWGDRPANLCPPQPWALQDVRKQTQTQAITNKHKYLGFNFHLKCWLGDPLFTPVVPPPRPPLAQSRLFQPSLPLRRKDNPIGNVTSRCVNRKA